MTVLDAPAKGQVVAANEGTLEELIDAVRREHQLAAEAGAAMVEHAIRAGDALISAKAQIDHGGWENWLKASFPEKHPKTLRLYMRLSRHQARIRSEGSPTIDAARRLLAQKVLMPARDELRAEAIRLVKKEGLTRGEAAARLGVHWATVSEWIDPKIAERRRRRARQETREARRAAQRRERDAAAKKAGGTIAKSYTLIRRTAEGLQSALDSERDREVRKHIALAMSRIYAAEDHIVKASRIKGAA